MAATVPTINGTQEVGVPGGGARMLVVYGTNLTKISSWELDEADGTLIAPLVVIFKGKTMTALALPASLAPPTYTLPGTYSLKYFLKTVPSSVLIHLNGGKLEDGSVTSVSLDPALRTDLDAALTAAQATDADHATEADHAVVADHALSADVAAALSTALSTSFFSAYDDLVAESKVGTGASQVAAGNHNHDTVYPTRTELVTPGTINNAGNLVEWSQIKGVPAGIADGVDDTGASSYSAGTGLSLVTGVFSVNFSGSGTAVTASRSDHDHDASYYTQAQLNATGGTINTLSNPVDWSRLKSVPAGFADGTDADTTYSNGTGLGLTGTTFSVLFGTTSTTVAVGNHTHSTYLGLTGGSLTGKLTISASSTQAISATSGDTSGTVGGIDCVTAGGIGVAGHGDVGVLGDLDSDGSYGVWGRATYNYQTGVYANATGQGGTALRAYSTGTYGTAVYAATSGNYSTAIRAYNYGGGAAMTAYSSGQNNPTIRVYSAYSGYGGTGISSRVGSSATAFSGRTGYYGTGAYVYAGRGGTGVYARAYRYGTGVRAYAGYRGYGLKANAGYGGVGASVSSYGGKSTGLRVSVGYTPNLAVFQYYGSNVARINHKGIAYLNGGYSYGGADFAESVKVDSPVEEFEPGDVMVIDPKAPRQFALSRESSSTLVAGVISTKPALLGTAHNAEKGGIAKRLKQEVKLGIVGIVPTKVCDEGGEIRIGDLLVTASVPGHAKKAPANPAVGTVIGKALGALDRGTGKIEVLLMAR